VAQADDAITAEAIKADQYYQASNVVDATPLYEELTKRDPTNAVFAERLAFCLAAQYQVLPDGEAKKALYQRAKTEMERARALGDDSSLIHTIAEQLATYAGTSGVPDNEATERMREAEAAFTRGDLDAALTKYQAIAEADPKSYEARLFAGDVFFRKGQLDQAAEWYGKAVAVDPDRETAYRYWADALVQTGDHEGALTKLLEAIIAEPYTPRPWDGLQAWARRHHAKLARPSVALSTGATITSEKANTLTIHLDPKAKAGDISADGMIYATTRGLWRSEIFAKRFPAEKQYRHSLPEEAEALKMVLVTAEPAVIERRYHDLAQLDKDGMIEAYVLLSAPDEGISKDYAGYRAEHRELLQSYLRKYVVKRR
jgi:tetratricopeptide (TPR) repeat protein